MGPACLTVQTYYLSQAKAWLLALCVVRFLRRSACTPKLASQRLASGWRGSFSSAHSSPLRTASTRWAAARALWPAPPLPVHSVSPVEASPLSHKRPAPHVVPRKCISLSCSWTERTESPPSSDRRQPDLGTDTEEQTRTHLAHTDIINHIRTCACACACTFLYVLRVEYG